MPVKTFRPLTPSTRYITIADFSDITKTKPEKSLVEIRKKTGGRNHYGRVTARGIGGGHKQKIRLVDFKRNKHGVEATVAAIEYDPMRSARLALLEYKDGEKRYIIAPVGVTVGRTISSGPTAPPEVVVSQPERESARKNETNATRVAGMVSPVQFSRRFAKADVAIRSPPMPSNGTSADGGATFPRR